MKSLMSFIISAGLFIIAVICTLAVSPPAHATCSYSSSSCTTPPPPPTTTTYTNNDDQTASTMKGIAIGLVLACVGVSIYNGRWCWQEKQEPLAEIYPLQVVPVSDPNKLDQYYLLEVR